MSNSASLSAAKRRRGGGPPIGQPLGVPGAPGVPGVPGAPPQMTGSGSGGLPPGLPPNFRQMPPQIQQQILRHMQQRMIQSQQAQQVQHQAQQAQYQAQQAKPNIGGLAMSSNNMNEKMPPQISGNGPYVVNSVLHTRAISEIDGIHIRDLPMSAAGLPCLPSGAALPPNILFKLHHDELLNQDAVMNEHSNRLQMLTNRVDKVERGGGGVGHGQTSDTQPQVDPTSLVNNTDFIAKILDNILTNTNLSDIINQIEPLQKENEALRTLINSQQTTLNELSALVMKFMNGSLPQIQQENLVADSFNTKYEDTKYECSGYINEAGEVGEATEEIHNVSLDQADQEDQEDQEDQADQDEHTECENNTAREV